MAVPDMNDAEFRDALRGLEHGDFTRLDPRFAWRQAAGQPSPIIRWHGQGLFRDEPGALAEALTCACFLGRMETVEYLLCQGVAPAGGAKTGLNALHWAVNRGQLGAVRMLLGRKAPLEARSMYGGNALDTAVWSALNEPKPDHAAIIDELLRAGARLAGEEYPTGRGDVDALLRQYGAV